MQIPDFDGAFAPVFRIFEQLSAGLEDGDDLNAILAVLADDLRSAIPSYLGLDLQMSIDGERVAIQWPTHDGTGRSSLSMRFPDVSAAEGTQETERTSTGRREQAMVMMTFRASARGAFDALADHARAALPMVETALDGGAAASAYPIISLAASVEVNQAVGVLLDQGHVPEDAMIELQRRAADAGTDLATAARRVLATLTNQDTTGDDPRSL